MTPRWETDGSWTCALGFNYAAGVESCKCGSPRPVDTEESLVAAMAPETAVFGHGPDYCRKTLELFRSGDLLNVMSWDCHDRICAWLATQDAPKTKTVFAAPCATSQGADQPLTRHDLAMMVRRAAHAGFPALVRLADVLEHEPYSPPNSRERVTTAPIGSSASVAADLYWRQLVAMEIEMDTASASIVRLTSERDFARQAIDIANASHDAETQRANRYWNKIQENSRLTCELAQAQVEIARLRTLTTLVETETKKMTRDTTLLCGMAMNCTYTVTDKGNRVRIKCALCGSTVLSIIDATMLRNKIRAGTFFCGSLPSNEVTRLGLALTKVVEKVGA